MSTGEFHPQGVAFILLGPVPKELANIVPGLNVNLTIKDVIGTTMREGHVVIVEFCGTQKVDAKPDHGK